MNPQVSQAHRKEKRWSAEYAALRQLCLASGLNEELKWGQACYDLDGGNVVLIHGFKEYCALLFMKGKTPEAQRRSKSEVAQPTISSLVAPKNLLVCRSRNLVRLPGAVPEQSSEAGAKQ